MTAATDNYAEVLYELGIAKESIQETRDIIKEVPEFAQTLANPTVPFETKCKVIDRVIPKEMSSFVKIVCRHRKIDSIDEMFESYEALLRKKQDILRATLRYVTAPNDEQLSKIREFLCKEFGTQDAEIVMQEDASLIGGFVLAANGKEYDWSLKGRFVKMEQRLTTGR